MHKAVESIRVKDATKFLEEVVLELICTCNVDTLVVSHGGVVKLPAKYAGVDLFQLAEEICGRCILIDDGRRQYLIKFYTLKTPVEKIRQVLELAAAERALL